MVQLITPVLLLVFNRPDTTRQVFEAIRQAKPKQLFVAADGPRPDKEGEKERCEEVRKIATAIDWDCELKTLFRDENLGCGRGPATSIDWFFENVEQGIILEDDCIPSSEFFSFMQENLNFYKHNDRLFHISGSNIQQGIKRGNASYYFSQSPHMWGWATWKRAWKYYSFKIENFNETPKGVKLDKFWKSLFAKIREGEMYSVWDYQWVYAIFKYNKLCITPNCNLIENIGFSTLATHTTIVPSWYKNVRVQSLGTFKHADQLKVNKRADAFTLKLLKSKIGIKEKIILKLLSLKNSKKK